MKYKKLFNPIKIRGLELKNRVVFPAMGTKMPGEDKCMTQQIIDYQVARVKGGCGLNFTEVCSVYDKASPKNFLAISDDKYIPGLKKLTDAIHQEGGKAGIQLWLGGLAAAHGDPEQKVIMPSPVPIPGSEHTIPGASIETIKETINAFGESAKRAVEAGFDTIEFHAGHNYTPHSFLSPYFNRRSDEYGGSFENRARYSLECIAAIRENIPEDMPLFMRIVAKDDYLEGGLTIEDMIEFSKLAKEAGVDVLDVSRGNFSTAAIKYEVPSIDLERGFNVGNAERIKRETGMTTIAVGRINDPAQAEKIIEDEESDMVVIGRAQLADPNFCNKAKAGEEDSIVRCIGCNQGCYFGYVLPEVPFITCLRNPALGREAESSLKKTDNPKIILIAGGGVAGMEVAIILKERGHEPIICEASDSLGGQFKLAGVAPRKEEMTEAAENIAKRVIRKGIEVKLNTAVTEEVIKELAPDEVIIAIGATPMELNIPGGDLEKVKNSHQVLSGEESIKGNVVVIGGGLVGLEVAEYLHDQTEKITIIEMLDQVAKDLGPIRKICVMENLNKFGIDVLTNTKCINISRDSVVVQKDGEEKEIACDSVVVAIGAKSCNSDQISSYCEQEDIPCHSIGDAVKARRAIDAIAEAHQIAREI